LIFIFMLLEPTMQACKVFVQLILDFYASWTINISVQALTVIFCRHDDHYCLGAACSSSFDGGAGCGATARSGSWVICQGRPPQVKDVLHRSGSETRSRTSSTGLLSIFMLFEPQFLCYGFLCFDSI
jgi:hypothetical protein